MQFLGRIFGAMSRAYLIRGYVIGVAIFTLLIWMVLSYLDSHPDKEFYHYGMFSYFSS